MSSFTLGSYFSCNFMLKNSLFIIEENYFLGDPRAVELRRLPVCYAALSYFINLPIGDYLLYGEPLCYAFKARGKELKAKGDLLKSLGDSLTLSAEKSFRF